MNNKVAEAVFWNVAYKQMKIALDELASIAATGSAFGGASPTMEPLKLPTPPTGIIGTLADAITPAPTPTPPTPSPPPPPNGSAGLEPITGVLG